MHGAEKYGIMHHFLDARAAGGALGPRDVVLDDGGTRFCGERSTTSGTSAARKLQTTGTGKETRPPAAEPAPQPEAPPLGRAPRPAAQPRGNRPPKKDRRTVGPPNSPTSPSGFSWSSSWTAASSGFWHVPARSGRSAAGPWNRTGSSNSCCGLGSAPR